MELADALRRRRMTRSFTPEPVAPEQLAAVLEVLGHLPSAGFTQGVEALVLTAAEARAGFWELASEPAWRASSAQAPGLLAAPVIVVLVADPSAYLERYRQSDKAASGLGAAATEWGVPYWLVDMAFAAFGLLLAAEDAGLGALLFRLHGDEAAILERFAVPEGFQGIGALAIGHRSPLDRTSGSPTRRARRPLEALVHRDHW